MDATYGVAATFLILFMKEIGVPAPIPSDLLMIGAGVQVALGAYTLSELAVAMVVAVAVGVTVRFMQFRVFGRAVLVAPSAIVLLAAAGLPLLLALVALGGLGVVVWLARWRGSARAWTEAACPACIASVVALPESVW
jgi:hypothetical protein